MPTSGRGLCCLLLLRLAGWLADRLPKSVPSSLLLTLGSGEVVKVGTSRRRLAGWLAGAAAVVGVGGGRC